MRPPDKSKVFCQSCEQTYLVRDGLIGGVSVGVAVQDAGSGAVELCSPLSSPS